LPPSRLVFRSRSIPLSLSLSPLSHQQHLLAYLLLLLLLLLRLLLLLLLCLLLLLLLLLCEGETADRQTKRQRE
jgi:hypothetical protein